MRRIKLLNSIGAVVGLLVVLLAVAVGGADCLDYCENGVVWSFRDILFIALAGASYLMTLVALYLALRSDPHAVRATRIAWLSWLALPVAVFVVEFGGF